METHPSEDTNTFSSDIPVEAEGFSEEERHEIIEQIEQVAARNRMSLASEREELQPQKRGSLFPIVVNLIAILCIAAGVFYSYRYFGRQEARLDTRAEGYLTTEGRIIDEVRRESQQQLEEKEQEISAIREDLRSIEEEQQNLEATMEQRIAEREAELREQMQQELARERERLEEQDLSAEEVRQRLEEFRQGRSQELEARMEELRRQNREELAEKQEELEAARQTAEEILQEAQQEREELTREAEEQVEELRDRFSAERERLEEETTEVGRELARLSEMREREQLMLDQMAAMYRDIQAAIEAGNTEQARSTIADFRELLRSPGIEDLPAIAERRDVELFLLNTLEESLRAAPAEEGEDPSLLSNARLVQEVRAAVERAREAEAQGNDFDAARFYTRAIETITAIKTAHEALLEISASRRRDAATERINLAQEELAEGNAEEALQILATAAAEAAGRTRDTVREAFDTMNRVLLGRSQELSGELAALEERNTALRRQVSALQEENSRLRGNLDDRRESNTQLEEELSQLEQRNTSLREELARIEQERARLQQQYQRARQRVGELEQDLEEAVDELAQFVSVSETDIEVQEVLDEYRRLVNRNRSFSGTGAADRQAAREAFRSFIRSREVRRLFPELPTIFQRLYGDADDGAASDG